MSQDETYIDRRLRTDPALRRPEQTLPTGVVLGRRPKPMPKTGPSEASEHERLAAALRRAGICFLHAPMGGARGRRSGAAAARMGASKGFPDFLIFDIPPQRVLLEWGFSDCVGLALEIKRPVRGSRPTKDQLEWLAKLAKRGWLVRVDWGADEALRALQALGYGV